MSLRRHAIIGIKAEDSRLPTEYQEIEYLQSSGKQYINIAFTPNQDTKTIMDFQIVTYSGTSMMFGARYNAATNAYGFGVGNTNKWRYVFASYGSQYSSETCDKNRHIVIVDKNKTYLDNVLKYTFTYIDFTAPVQMFLFGSNAGVGDISLYTISAKIFSCKVYDNNVLVRDLIPCYRKSDNIAGMFDIVNNVFYVNSGTGNFIVGDDV